MLYVIITKKKEYTWSLQTKCTSQNYNIIALIVYYVTGQNYFKKPYFVAYTLKV